MCATYFSGSWTSVAVLETLLWRFGHVSVTSHCLHFPFQKLTRSIWCSWILMFKIYIIFCFLFLIFCQWNWNSNRKNPGIPGKVKEHGAKKSLGPAPWPLTNVAPVVPLQSLSNFCLWQISPLPQSKNACYRPASQFCCRGCAAFLVYFSRQIKTFEKGKEYYPSVVQNIYFSSQESKCGFLKF